jgi:pSer/pThr/pTyr-binding forkhead associated (FHA) protein
MALVFGEPVRLGRHEPGAVGEGLGACPNVSRLHAQLELRSEGVIVTDLGSTNGTFVGESRLEPGVPTEVSANTTLRFAADRVIRIEN